MTRGGATRGVSGELDAEGATVRRLAKAILLVGVVWVLVLAMAGTGSAQQYPPDQNGDIVLPNIITRGPAPDDEVQPARQGQLPVTGAEVLLFVLVGSAVMGSGTFLVRRSHRKIAGN